MQKEFASRKFYAFLNAYCLKPHLIKSLNSLDSFRTYGGLLKIKKKTKASSELYLPENDFQNSSTKNFPKKQTSKFWWSGNQLKS